MANAQADEKEGPLTAIEPDLFGPSANKQWFETYRLLRETSPVYQVPGSNLFVLTRHDLLGFLSDGIIRR